LLIWKNARVLAIEVLGDLDGAGAEKRNNEMKLLLMMTALLLLPSLSHAAPKLWQQFKESKMAYSLISGSRGCPKTANIYVQDIFVLQIPEFNINWDRMSDATSPDFVSPLGGVANRYQFYRPDSSGSVHVQGGVLMFSVDFKKMRLQNESPNKFTCSYNQLSVRKLTP
jgi:hypothetical protein